ncbi:HutD/Ves family protein [Cognatiluteimonas profundi]|uniref:HutD/Ves family protein n=1 Tax=Cognatiluteimonas profundi TaxID=2594501 RepID=UPI00131BF31F|nr:HutD family protein [Lysobacter profundi]
MTDACGATRVIRANTYQRERWKNGLGWTREITRSPGQGDWDWRLSIAEIDDDAPFSRFEDVDRELVLLAGNGLSLQFDDGVEQILQPPHDRARFAGERGVTGRLVDGPTQDFNLMWRRDRMDARLWHRPLVGPMVIFVDPGHVWALYLMGGQGRFADASALGDIGTGDTALLVGGDARQRFVLDGGGEVLVIQLQPKGH